jgi:hypothetical protein
MKTKTFVAIVVLAVILLGLKVVHSQLSPQPFRPFVVTKTMSSPVAGRPLPLVQIYSLAVRDDGSFVRIAHVQNVVPGRTAYIRDIYDMQTGIWTTVDELSKSTETRHMSEHQMSTLKANPAASCGGKSAGEILGQKVEYVENTREADDGYQITTKKWSATALGCITLREETIMKTKDGTDWNLVADTNHQAISLTFQSVQQFFDVPSDYVERKPSEVLNELHRLYPEHFELTDTSGADAAYQANHVDVKR